MYIWKAGQIPQSGNTRNRNKCIYGKLDSYHRVGIQETGTNVHLERWTDITELEYKKQEQMYIWKAGQIPQSGNTRNRNKCIYGKLDSYHRVGIQETGTNVHLERWTDITELEYKKQEQMYIWKAGQISQWEFKKHEQMYIWKAGQISQMGIHKTGPNEYIESWTDITDGNTRNRNKCIHGKLGRYHRVGIQETGTNVYMESRTDITMWEYKKQEQMYIWNARHITEWEYKKQEQMYIWNARHITEWEYKKQEQMHIWKAGQISQCGNTRNRNKCIYGMQDISQSGNTRNRNKWTHGKLARPFANIGTSAPYLEVL